MGGATVKGQSPACVPLRTAGGGKTAIAEKLRDLTGFRLFHNHLTVNAVREVFEFRSPPFVEVLHRSRLEVFETAMRAGVSLIVTNSSAWGGPAGGSDSRPSPRGGASRRDRRRRHTLRTRDRSARVARSSIGQPVAAWGRNSWNCSSTATSTSANSNSARCSSTIALPRRSETRKHGKLVTRSSPSQPMNSKWSRCTVGGCTDVSRTLRSPNPPGTSGCSRKKGGTAILGPQRHAAWCRDRPHGRKGAPERRRLQGAESPLNAGRGTTADRAPAGLSAPSSSSMGAPTTASAPLGATGGIAGYSASRQVRHVRYRSHPGRFYMPSAIGSPGAAPGRVTGREVRAVPERA